MAAASHNNLQLPPEQQAIRDKCLHPSGTFVEFPLEEIEQSITDRFEKIVQRYPERLAVKMGDRALTYDELNRAANRIARAILDRQGSRPEPVVVLFEQGVDAIAAIWGVLKAGKFYVPVSATLPDTRIAAVVEDAQSGFLIANTKNLAAAGKANKNLLNIDEIDLDVRSENVSLPISPDDLAYIIYTSGTTGKPKGVYQKQRNVLQWTRVHSNASHIGAADRLSLIHSHSTSGGTHRMFDALLNGAALFPFDFQADGVKLSRWLVDERITIYQSAPLVFRQWVDALMGLEAFPELRLIRLSGMPMSAEDWARYRSHFSPDCLLVHVLGTSEAGTLPHYFIDKLSKVSESPVPVGYSIGDSTVYVADESGRRVAPGAVGEIVIQSRYLACGYWRNTELTNEKFLADAEGSDERLFLTGDWGRMSADGCLYHLGRKDLRVKIRGYSVEVGEIEGTLREHPAIKEVVVVAGADANGEPRLIAYLVPALAAELTASALRNYSIAKLPEYMVPSIFVTLPVMPLTPNGKIDRKALPAPPNARPRLEAAYVAPRTPLEEELKKIWSEVLGLDEIGVRDNFLDLGGHSLRAAQVLARIRQVLQLDIPLQTFFATPTLSALSDYVENQRQAPDPAKTFSLKPVSRQDSLPLSFAQQRLWFLDQLEPASVRYNVALAFQITGTVDVELLKQCLNEIVRRHESLRTVIAVVDGHPCQRILPSVTLDLPIVDLSQSIPEAAHESAMQQFIAAEAQRRFDLYRGPLIRSSLVSLEPERRLLLLTLHHIVFDGWSGAIMLRELASLYTEILQGKPPSLAEVPVQYADYAAWQRHSLQGPVAEELLLYWKKRLANLAPLQLPTDHPRPSTPNYRGARQFFSLGVKSTHSLKALARQENATLFIALLAAFQTLLHRYTGQTDIVTGTPVAGRRHADIENLIGFFLNMLVLRLDLSGNPTFRELVAQARQTCLEAYAHEDLPFEMLVEELKPQRTINQNPLFQVTFVLQNFPKASFASSDLVLVELDIDPGIARFDLHCFMTEEENGLKGYFEYNTALFDAATIERMVDDFQKLLAGVAANPVARVSDLAILTEAEKHQLLVEWNDTQQEYPQDKCVQQLFEAQAERTPDAIAVVFKDQELTYRELNDRANQLARYLGNLGVGSEVLVGICVERSIEMVVGLLAILKAGGAYVPLDPGYPAERLQFMLDDSEAALVLTQENLLAIFAGSAVGSPTSSIENPKSKTCPEPSRRIQNRVICLDRVWPTIEKESRENLVTELAPEDLAYVMYTSGSTGQPKGVEVPHRGIARLLFGVEYAEFGADQTFLHLAPTAFDASTFEIWGALLHGSRCVLYPSGVPSPQEIGAAIKQHGVTTLWLTASLYNAVIDEVPAALQGVKQLLIGGEALSLEHVRKGLELLPQTQIINGYGPTESTTFACCYRIPRKLDADLRSVPIGKPIGSTKIYILDPKLKPVPIGVVGEIHIGGAGLARGYFNDLELTAQRFIYHSFDGDPAQRLYRTGDLARYRADGNIEFIGRIDNQVKIRGYRIELGEIESVLARHEAVSESVVIATEYKLGDPSTVLRTGKQLIAYVVRRADAVAASELREFLRQKLPEYMVPAAFVFVEALPLTANGKVDRKALPAPEQSRSNLDNVFVAPRSPREEILAHIWAEVLRIDALGVHDNFFQLGGHSLLATQVVSRIRNAFGIALPLRTLFERPTIAGLAESMREGQQEPRVQPIKAIGRDGDIPVSFAQQRLWFLDQLEPDSATYNLPAAMRLSGALNIAALEHSLNAILVRHEALRTVFPQNNVSPTQKILPRLEISLKPMDLSATSEREEVVQQQLQQRARQLFDLAHGPLIRAHLWRLAAQDHVLLINVHHIVCDGWSMGVLFGELADLYRAYRIAEPSPLAQLPIQYADYAVWQRDRLQGDYLDEQVSYWRTKLNGVTTLELPTDHPRPAFQTHRGSTQRAEFSAQLTKGIKAVAQREGATLFMTLLAAFQAWLSRYSGQQDIAVGSPIAGRTHQEAEGLIGFFVNTLVLRADLSNNPRFKALLGQVRETTLEAYTHQELPFEKLVEELQPERNISAAPLFQVMFAMQDARDRSLELEGISAAPIRPPTHTAKFDLMLTMIESEGALDASLNYNTDLFEASTIERMLGHFETLLQDIVRDPEQRISDLPLLREAEKHQLLVQWNDTQTDYPSDQCIHQLFEQQVEKTPDAVAVVCKDQELTYRELNGRANQLAHYLKKLGVGPEVLVGICGERSIEMVVELLGILKAGGAYVPLDLNYPAERLKFILEDAEVAVILKDRDRFEGIGQEGRVEPRIQQVRLDKDWESIGKESAANPENTAAVNNLAYLVYTSGSTGRPKGVAIEHRNAAAFLSWVHSAFTREELSGVLASTSICFDLSVFEIFAPLTCGGSVILAENALALATMPMTAKVTLLNAVPSAMTELLTLAAIPSSVRVINLAGEPLRPELVRRIYEATAVDKVHDLYGPSECTTYSSWTHRTTNGPQTIGRPIANTRIYLLDGYRNPVPIGVVGEIYIGGDGVARGYLNRPELTAEKFIHHSFDDQPAQRLYRTGDLARYLANGNIEFLGRIDNQVKIRGYRIELGEIESVLAQHAAVRECAVVACDDAGLDSVNPKSKIANPKFLVAYVVRRADAVAASELRDYLKTKLPDYMVPSAFVFLDSLPLTPNGKVDRRALPEPDHDQRELTERFIAPRNPVEETIAAVWREILGKSRIGVHDNFFDLGGHSLKATQVVSRLRVKFGSEIPLRHMFEYPTIAELGLAIGAQQQEQSKVVDQLLSEIEAMTEEEAQKHMAGKSNGGDNIV